MAGFILDRFDGSQQPIEVDHAITVKQTGLTWVGQYYSKFGEILLENMLHLSENFAGPVPPNSFDSSSATFGNLLGQLWYDTDESATINNKILKVYDGNGRTGTDGWKRIEPILGESNPTIYTEGELFYNTERRTIEMARSNRWEQLSVELSYDSERLVGIEGQFYMRKDIDQTMNGLLTTTNIRPLTNRTYNLGQEDRRWNEVYSSTLDTEFSKDLIPLSNTVFNLGSNIRKWNDAYINVVRGDNYTDLNPLVHLSNNIGTNLRKWNNVYARTSYINFHSTLIPRNTTQTVGTSVNRWEHGYYNNLNLNSVSSNLLPLNNNLTIGSSSNKWNELYVNVIKSTNTETLLPANATVNLGSSTNKFNNMYANVVRGDSYLHLLPLSNTTYNLGSLSLKWNNGYIANAYIDFYNTLTPRNSSQSIGTTSTRWNNTYLNNLNVNQFTTNIIPNANNSLSLGTSSRNWGELNVNVIRSTKVETLTPNTTSTNIGTSSNPFNILYVRDLPQVRMIGDMTFDIVRNGRSRGLYWRGLTDHHEIFVEEVSNNEKTHLVIENRDNPDDSTRFRNNGNDVLEVKSNKVEAYEDIQAHKRIIMGETTSGNGISMEFNSAVGSIEFKFL